MCFKSHNRCSRIVVNKAVRKLFELNEMHVVDLIFGASAIRITRLCAFVLRHCAQSDPIYSTNAAESSRGGTKEAV